MVAKIPLNNSSSIPQIGIGSWAGWDEQSREQAKDWLSTALNAGYRHVDTGRAYGTEACVGDAIRASGIPREDIFVTSKLLWNHHSRVKESLNESLQALGFDYIDLYLMHWPQAFVYEEGNILPTNVDGSYKMDEQQSFNNTWAEMERLLQTGKVRAIGVSNFSIKTLEELLKTANVVPANNQVELHPYLAQNALVEYCKKKGIVVTAYTPTGGDAVRNDPVIASVARKYNATPTQIILAWHISRGVVVVPKSSNAARQKENFNIPTLDTVDIELINQLDKNERIIKADERGQVLGWTYEQLGW